MLEKVPHKEKIVFLNYMKYHMEMEQHAYNQDLMYAKILKRLGKPVDRESLQDYAGQMFFPEKIDIVNRLIREDLYSNKIS